MTLRIKVEDYYSLLEHAKGLWMHLNIEESSPLKVCANRLKNISTETLWAVACELLTCVNANFLQTLFMMT